MNCENGWHNSTVVNSDHVRVAVDYTSAYHRPHRYEQRVLGTVSRALVSWNDFGDGRSCSTSYIYTKCQIRLFNAPNLVPFFHAKSCKPFRITYLCSLLTTSASSNVCFMKRQKFLKSLSVLGSVASTSKRSPIFIVRTLFLTIIRGSGQTSPRVSTKCSYSGGDMLRCFASVSFLISLRSDYF